MAFTMVGLQWSREGRELEIVAAGSTPVGQIASPELNRRTFGIGICGW
jgi:hypothetical protein